MRSNKQIKIKQARKFRKEATPVEERLWWLLRNREMLGYKFRRQYVFKGFILDFYCPLEKLGIEIDGEIHLKQKDYDFARKKVIEESGIKLLRFTNSDLFNNPKMVLKTIANNLSPALIALSAERRGGTRRVGEDVGNNSGH